MPKRTSKNSRRNKSNNRYERLENKNLLAANALIPNVDATSNEDTLVIRGDLTITDPDPGENAFVTGQFFGEYGRLSIGENTITGDFVWSYQPERIDLQPLNEGDVVQDVFTLTSVDGSTGTFVMNIEGLNDAARILGTVGSSPSEDLVGTSGNLTVTDIDEGESSFTPSVETKEIGTLEIDATGAWVFTTDSPAVQYLKEGESITETFTVSSFDGTTQDIAITIEGANDEASLNNFFDITEDELQFTGRPTISDPDAGEERIEVETIVGTYGILDIKEDSELRPFFDYRFDPSDGLQSLNEGDLVRDIFTITSIDGSTGTLVINIEGVNDVARFGGISGGGLLEDRDGRDGDLDVFDVDEGEASFVPSTVTKSIGTVEIDATGDWTFTTDNDAVQYLVTGQTVEELFTVNSLDGTPFDITIQIFGSDDTASILDDNVGNGFSADIGEDDPSVVGSLTVVDPDAGQAAFEVQSATPGAFGDFSISSTGEWAYSLDNSNLDVQALNEGETLSESFDVTSLDGNTTRSVAINIIGSNDAPVFGGDSSVSVTEDTTDVLTGVWTVTGSDPDLAFVPGDYGGGSSSGTLSLAADGSWSFTVNNDVLQFYNEGLQVEGLQAVRLTDGSLGFFTVQVLGIDDLAVIAGDLEGTAVEGQTTSVQGTATSTDVDEREVQFFVPGTVIGTYGSLELETNGNWTYTLDDNAAQAIPAGATVTDQLPISTDDGATEFVQITITGQNNVAVISGTNTGTTDADSTTPVTGSLSVTDADAGESIFANQTDIEGNFGTFSIDANGQWTYVLDNDSVAGLSNGQSVTDSFTVASLDGSATTAVLVTIDGVSVLTIPGIIDEVEELLDNGTLDNGEANPIINFLDQAQDNVNKGKISQAIRKLEDARDRVQELFDDGELTSEEADQLVASIEAVIGSLS